MKKIIFTFVVMLFSLLSFADDSFRCGVWFDCPRGIGSSEVEGLRLGIPVAAGAATEGAELSIIASTSRDMEGFQFSFFGVNCARKLDGLQLAFVNLVEGSARDLGVQWGFFNHCAADGVQLGFINNNNNNARFQLGLVNINRNGWLPVMIFVNFADDLFD